MKLALINNLHVDHLGFYYISAVAKNCGWDTQLFLTDTSLTNNLRKFAPDAFAFTATTGNHQWVVELAKSLRLDFPKAYFFLGGPHPTYYPEIIQSKVFDAIVRGEGEETFAEILRAIDSNESFAHTKGTWTYQDGQVLQNDIREAPQDLDAIPFADRTIYDNYPWMHAHKYPLMISSRGCPFHCTFCYSPTMADMSKGLGKFVRFRSVDNVIQEGQLLVKRYNPKIVEFVDDIFGMKRPWLKEFSARWRDEVGLPFNICIRADLIDEESAQLLADAGCNSMHVGVEAGNDRIRNEVLRKDLARERVFEAAKLIRSHGMRFVTLNIMGSPGETVENCLETLTFNQQLKPDYSQCSVLVPFPRTGIYQKAVDAGNIDKNIAMDDFAFSFFERPPLERNDLGGILNLQRVFALVVRFPVLTPLARWLSKKQEIKVLYFLFPLMHLIFYYRIKKISLLYLLRLTLNMKEIVRRHKAGHYAKILPAKTAPK